MNNHTIPPPKLAGVRFNGNQPESMRKDLVLDDGGIVEHVHCLDCHRRDFSEEDPAEGIGDGDIDADEIEF